MPGVCYSALRRLPRRDLHPLETGSVKQTMSCLLLHDAPWGQYTDPQKVNVNSDAVALGHLFGAGDAHSNNAVRSSGHTETRDVGVALSRWRR